MQPTFIYVRPKNLYISNLLQPLSLANHFSRKSGNKLTSLEIPKIPENQKLQNFCGLQFQDYETALTMVSPSHDVSLSGRAVLDSAQLNVNAPLEERHVGLSDVASLVGIDPTVLAYGREKRESDEQAEEVGTEQVIADKSSFTLNVFTDLRQHSPNRLRAPLSVKAKRRLEDAYREYRDLADEAWPSEEKGLREAK